MCLLLVVVFLFSSSSCIVSSHQYYVSDNCSSVTYTPCAPLSVYARNISQYNNTIFYFIGTSYVTFVVNLDSVKNITLCGLGYSPLVECSLFSYHYNSFVISWSSYVTFSNMSLHLCGMSIQNSNNITITDSSFRYKNSEDYGLELFNAFDTKVLSSFFKNAGIIILYSPPSICCNELHHYSLTMTNVTLLGKGLVLELFHGTSYNLSVTLEYVNISNILKYNENIGSIALPLYGSLYYFVITNSTVYNCPHNIGFSAATSQRYQPKCDIYGVQSSSIFVIEDSQFYGNREGLWIGGDLSNERTKYFHVMIKSCLIYHNNHGLRIDGSFLTASSISIIDTKITNNTKNTLRNCHSITFSNVTIANSLSTGLALRGTILTVDNSLIVINNTGVVGGGLALNESSYMVLLPQASLKFLNNKAYYKGGGLYSDGSALCSLQSLNSRSFVPVAFWNNTAGVAGDDMYGIIMFYQYCDTSLNSTNPHVRSSNNADTLHFCDPDNAHRHHVPAEGHIFPGQKLKFYVALFGPDYENLSSNSRTDGTVYTILDKKFVNATYITSTCSLVEYTPSQTDYARHLITLSLGNNYYSIHFHFTVHECPIGFSIDHSHGFCTCSQSVARENVTCDIDTLNITHNGLMWIGTNDTSTPFNANQTNPNACIINEDCLLYCSPNPVTFKMNDTDPQCVDDRGQVMCGSCRDGYSLLMGSNKCGHCDNDYTIIAWIALFAVMGILLVVVLIALNLTASVGTLNGLLFYANIVKLYGPVFSRKGAIPMLSQIISWINLDFGIEACFYNGMGSYAKQWLQFAFPFYLWMIIIVVIWLCRRYGKISRLMGSHAVPVLSTLFLLSYTKLVRTIVIVLHKRDITLHCINGSTISVSKWYEDPNVDYAKGKHAGLFAFALFVSFVFVIPYTLFLSFSPLFEKYFSNYKVFKKLWSQFKPIIDAYSGPMKDEYRFWPGLLLVARLPILLSVTLVDSFIESHYFLLCVLLTVLAVVLSLGHCFGGFYRKRMNNMIEVWFLFNLCIMVGLSGAYNNDNSAVLIWYNTCLSVFTATFLAIAIYHLYLQLSYLKWYNTLMEKIFKKQDKDEPLLDITESHKTVDEQMREIVPSSSDINLSHESVVDLF